MLFTIVTGRDFNASGERVSPVLVQHVTEQALDRLAHEFGGGTLEHTEGSWLNARHEVITEHGLKFTVLVDVLSPDDERVQLETVDLFARWLKTELAQESVLVTWTPTEFYSII